MDGSAEVILDIQRKHKQDIINSIIHVKQSYAWDCGLACAEMILRSHGISHCGLRELADIIGTQSVWSIDIVYLFKRFNINCKYCTIIMGVDVQHANLEFYQATFDQDARRINALFSEACVRGVSVEQRSITLEEIKQHLFNGNPVIVLVDMQYLRCIECTRLSCFSSPYYYISSVVCLPIKSTVEYAGHYIILCKYNSDSDLFEYKDPSKCASACFIRSEHLEIARKSAGTDEDIIFITHDTTR